MKEAGGHISSGPYCIGKSEHSSLSGFVHVNEEFIMQFVISGALSAFQAADCVFKFMHSERPSIRI